MTFLASLQPRERRTVFFGALAIVLMVSVARGVPAWRRWNAEARATAAEALERAARGDSVLRGLSESLDTLEARTTRLAALKSALLAGETASDAAANLTVVLADAARRALVRLDAVEVRIDSVKSKRLPRIVVDVQATADIAGLAALLRDLEDGPSLLAVRRVTVRPQSPDTPANQVELLSVRLTIEGAALVLRRSNR